MTSLGRAGISLAACAGRYGSGVRGASGIGPGRRVFIEKVGDFDPCHGEIGARPLLHTRVLMCQPHSELALWPVSGDGGAPRMLRSHGGRVHRNVTLAPGICDPHTAFRPFPGGGGGHARKAGRPGSSESRRLDLLDLALQTYPLPLRGPHAVHGWL